jgi:CheY-like chemotaxis protein
MAPRWAEPAQDALIPSTSGILVVDDEPGVRSFLQRGLALNGFRVWLAAEGEEAIRTYQDHHDSIAVVLMDVCMPGMDGPTTLAALRSVNARVRCCFMSGGAGDYSGEELLAGGASHLFAKPFSLVEAVPVLLRVASDHRSQVA